MGTIAERWNAFRLRLMALFRHRKLQDEMAEEMAFHQTMLREKLAREGIPAADVDAKLRRRFGNAGRWRERCAELWQFPALENFLRDLGFSVRLLRKSPGFAVVAILTLALGVGANTAVFSLIDGLMLRPLPVPNADRLVVLGLAQREMQHAFSVPLFRALEKRSDIFQNVFASASHTFQLHEPAGTENIQGALVSGQYFDALQTPPRLGRYLTPADDRTGGNPNGLAVVISEGFWKTHFNSARDVVGRKMVLDNVPFTVVGVMPKRFIGTNPTERPEIFAALATEPLVDAPFSYMTANWWWIEVSARMRPSLTLAQTNAVLRAVSQPILNQAIPLSSDWTPDGVKRSQVYFAAEPGSKGYSYLRNRFRKPLMLIFFLCAAVLVLACLNLASLLMARAAAREREISTRLAVGATRRRLMQQLLVESLMLATLGTSVGMALSPLASHALAALLTGGSGEVHLDTSPDLRVLLFGALIAIVSTVLIGIAPALQATSGNLNDRIKDASRALHAHERRRILPRVLLSTEVALALILVVGAGLLSASLMRLHRIGLGFDPHHLVLLPLTMDKQPLDGNALLGLYRDFADQLSHQPGVASISYANITPMMGSIMIGSFDVAGHAMEGIYMARIAPGFFHTMRIPMLSGRGFHWNDTPASGQKVILNQAAAELMFPDGKMLGRNIQFSKGDSSYEVVGVVGNVKYGHLRDADPPTVYFPITQNADKKPSYMAVVRLSGPATPIASAARSIAARLAPETPSPVMVSMEGQIDQTLTSERMMAMLSLFFAACALLVTGIGLYGTLAYTTARRTSEIGIRMALGAQRRQVVLLVFRENALVAGIGAAAGVAIAIAASRAMASFLYDTSPRDPWVLLFSALALGFIASVASLLPAIRAARIDPMEAIRCE